MHISTFKRTALSTLLAASLGTGLSGCLEESSDENKLLVEGMAVASGAITGTVEVLDSEGSTIISGDVASGAFSFNVNENKTDEEMTFVVTGTYTDSLSGEEVTLDEENALALTVPANTYVKGKTANVPITPGSTVISHLIRHHNKTIVEAKAAFKDSFGYEPNMDAKPFSPSSTDSDAATARPQADRDAAFRAGAFSQLASELSLTSNEIIKLLRAVARDLADGSLDGSDGIAPIQIGNQNMQTLHETLPLDARVLGAYSGFASSSKNSSGVTAPGTDLPKVNYDIPGASKTITVGSAGATRNITVTLNTEANPPIPGGFWTARVNHKITLKDDSNVPIDITNDSEILDIGQHPNMRMISGHIHSTPHSMMANKTDAANGIYHMDSYYVMASEMGMGENAQPMGLWSYTVKLTEDTDADGEADKTHSVVFHPQVKMPMAMGENSDVDVLFSKIGNSEFQWTTMMGKTEPRPFRIWLHEVKANIDSSSTLTVFVSTRDIGNSAMPEESGDSHMHKTSARAMDMDHGSMMKFPAVYTGQMLHGPANSEMNNMRPEVPVDSVTVQVSTDGGSTFQSLTEGMHGLYTIDALMLTAGEQNSLAFKLTVNEKEMTVSNGDNGVLAFTPPTLAE